MNHISLERIIVNKNKVDFYFTSKGNVQKYFKSTNHLFYEYNYDLSEIPKSMLVIPFLANIAPLIWISDSTIKLQELDKSFYECLDKIKAAYQKMYPRVSFGGNIEVEQIIENYFEPEHEAAQLFSGGLDALATFIRIKSRQPILITEYGWHENDIKMSDVWEADKNNAIKFSMSNGLENILIQSNYGTFIKAEMIDKYYKKKLGDNWWHGLHHSLAIISAAIPLAYKLKVKTIYIASSFYQGYQATCASDPTVDNEIKFAAGSVFHDAYELTRQEKVKIVTEYYASNKEPVTIRVCFKNNENCCNCEKCLRTILGIVAEGANPRDFGFNIPNDLSLHVREFLFENVKYFTPSKIDAWDLIKKRMRNNSGKLIEKELLEWFTEYDFALEQKKSLFKYRATKFIPIIKRRITIKLNNFSQKNN